MKRFACALLFAGACSEPAAPFDDLAVPADLGSDALLLTVGGAERPLDAWYSIYVEPFSELGPMSVTLVVTVIDPAFACAGAGKPSGLDAVSFAFASFNAGVDTTGVFARSGPIVGPTSGGSGSAQLLTVDDRYQGEDAGAISVGAGGRVTGEVHYQLAPMLRVDGRFSAAHCPALDFVASP